MLNLRFYFNRLVFNSILISLLFLSISACAADTDNNVNVDIDNAIVKCSNMDMSMADFISQVNSQIEAAGTAYPLPQFGVFDETTTISEALSRDQNNLSQKILQIKATLPDGKDVILGGITQKNDSGLRSEALFCGLGNNFRMGAVTEVTFSLRNKDIVYPPPGLHAIPEPEDKDANKGFVDSILKKIENDISGSGSSDNEAADTASQNTSDQENNPPLNETISALKELLTKNNNDKKNHAIEFDFFSSGKNAVVKDNHGNVTTDYDKDAEVNSPSPDSWLLVTYPETSKNVADIISIANKFNIPWIARGAGTSLTGSSVPMSDSIIIDLSRYMNKIGPITESADGSSAVVLAQAGAINGDVKNYVGKIQSSGQKYLWRFSPTPASYFESTVAGNLANNAVGMNGAKEGATGIYINAATLVTPRGNIVTLRRDQPEERVVLDLLAGSEGRLGVFTDLELILSKPIPQDNIYTLLFKFDSSGAAINAITGMHQNGIVPLKMEFMDTQAVAAINYVASNKLPIPYAGQIDADGYYKDANSVILFQITGKDKAAVDSKVQQVKQIIGETYSGLIEAYGTNDQDKVNQILNARVFLFLIVSRYMLDKKGLDSHLDMDPIVPLGQTSVFYNKIQSYADSGFVIPVFCHAGDMICHPLIFYSSSDLQSCKNALDVMEKIDMDAAVLSGEVSGEHGIGFKLSYILNEELVSSAEGENEKFLQECILNAFSPASLANPGKILIKGTPPASWKESIFYKTKIQNCTPQE